MRTIPPFVFQFVKDVEEDGVAKLHVYDDGGGVATIGFGHTGPDVRFGMPAITEAQADAWLAVDLQDAAQCVDSLCTKPLNDHQRGALISFVFNEGKGAFAGSTLLRRLNMGDYNGVPIELMRWDKGHVGSQSGPLVEINGLKNRRAKEVALWLVPDAPGQAPAPVPPVNDWHPEPPIAVDPGPDETPPPAAGEPWTLTKIIAAITSGGGAMVLSFINSPYALIALALLLVFGYFIYREYSNKRK